MPTSPKSRPDLGLQGVGDPTSCRPALPSRSRASPAIEAIALRHTGSHPATINFEQHAGLRCCPAAATTSTVIDSHSCWSPSRELSKYVQCVQGREPADAVPPESVRAGSRNIRVRCAPSNEAVLLVLTREGYSRVVFGLCMVAVTVWVLITYYYAEQFTRYPAPIAQSLRRALYYSNYAPDTNLALKWYTKALQQCDEHHLDYFSDEVMGIKFQMAAWLERIESHGNAVKILELQLSECRRWVDVFGKAVAEGTAPKAVRPATPEEEEAGTIPETLWGKRTRILAKAIGISVKLGQLYADEHVMEPELAHDRLLWAVETLLKELGRRQAEGLKEGEGEWMQPEAIGGALEGKWDIPSKTLTS